MSTGFQFKQFFVRHDCCAMKVGTDGVLLGAWAPVPAVSTQPSACKILDIGTGSGLIALMLAQRCPEAQIDAIDIDQQACEQAAANFAASPWAERLHATHCPLQQLANNSLSAEGGLSSVSAAVNQPKAVYNLILSNPPYFVDSLKNPDAARSTARHNDTLPFGELIACSTRLLAPNGILALIVPAEAEPELQALAMQHGLSCTHRCYVHPKPGRPAKRVLLAWQRTTSDIREIRTDHLTLESADAPRSPEYQQLTRDFYL